MTGHDDRHRPAGPDDGVLDADGQHLDGQHLDGQHVDGTDLDQVLEGAGGPGTDVPDPRIAAAVARLDGLEGRPPSEHVEVYEEVHRVLQDALADATRAGTGTGTGEQGDRRR